MADPVEAEVLDAGGFTDNKGVANALTVAINQVNEVLSGVSMTAQTNHDIKLYMACHYTELTQRQGSLVSNKLGEAREDYADIYSAGLFATRFGQMACMLDVSGKLSAVAQQAVKPAKKAQFTHVEPAPFEEGDDLI